MSAEVVVPIASVALSVGSSAVVAILVPRFNANREDERADRVANNARVDELRGVLESAGMALQAAIEAVSKAERTLFAAEVVPRPNHPFPGRHVYRPSAKDDVFAADAAYDAVKQAENRIRIRLGPGHRLTVAYVAAVVGLGGCMRRLTSIALREEYTERLSDEFNVQRDGAIRYRDEFFEVTAHAVGPDLPIDPAFFRPREDE